MKKVVPEFPIESADICVVTSYQVHQEPRAPRSAKAWAEAFPSLKVLFIDCAPEGAKRSGPAMLEGIPNLRWLTHSFPTRQSNPAAWLLGKAAQKAAKWNFRSSRMVTTDLLSPERRGLRRVLVATRARVYHAFKWEAMLPLLESGADCSQLVFDCMEFYSDMGEDQHNEMSASIRRAETKWLPACRLLTASSPEVAVAYRDLCPTVETISLYNCPDPVPDLSCAADEPIRLYWRNSVLRLSQRGLQDALDALVRLPEDVTLHVQGYLPPDGGRSLREAIEQRGLSRRVSILGPHAMDEAIVSAARFNVGLCLERDVNMNHRLTVSNKMFDYHMAGMAVVSSDLPSLRNVISSSRGGLLYKPGDCRELASCVARLREDKSVLRQLRSNARKYALSEGNSCFQMGKFQRKAQELFGKVLS